MGVHSAHSQVDKGVGVGGKVRRRMHTEGGDRVLRRLANWASKARRGDGDDDARHCKGR